MIVQYNTMLSTLDENGKPYGRRFGLKLEVSPEATPDIWTLSKQQALEALQRTRRQYEAEGTTGHWSAIYQIADMADAERKHFKLDTLEVIPWEKIPAIKFARGAEGSHEIRITTEESRRNAF